ncbi:MAG TPA: cupredoxin domain-containing protein [Sphingobium sp.]|nr:cupredoxin domain-containing protein [Sphingobium sp.]
MRHFLLPLVLLPSPLLAQDAPAPETVKVELSSFRFSPRMVEFEHGKRYVLHLVNLSDGGHNFVAKAFFAAARIDPADQEKVRNGRVEVGGGKETVIHLTAPAPGNYKLHCSHFMHAPFGMTGQIVVR